jgi:uncharacterized protein (DUF3820 family)
MTNEDGKALLMSLVETRMPFGKYEGQILSQLPVAYLEWFARKGFPAGKLGHQLSIVHTLKTNGDQAVLDGLYKVVHGH